MSARPAALQRPRRLPRRPALVRRAPRTPAAALGLLALLVALCAGAPGPARAQGFAGLGTEAEGFAVPVPGRPLVFPEDHGAHPAYRIEWWYLTALLTGEDGRDYGAQWTLFRTALAPREAEGWASPQLWMGHAGLTTPEAHFSAERLARGGIGQAGVEAEPFRAWIDAWEASGPSLSQIDVTAQDARFGFALRFATDAAFVPQGQGGYSVKSAEGQASYYYSQPFYEVSGTIRTPGGPVAVSGTGWLDREWSSQPLSADQTGWDWFSLVFESGARMMGFRLRARAGPPFTAATWITPDGTPTPYPDGAFTAEPLATARVAGREVPVRWRLALPARGLDVEAAALNPDAWMDTRFPYWEGPVTLEGSHTGRGYLEMTGYE
jgi:predicted secreted hydrolase